MSLRSPCAPVQPRVAAGEPPRVRPPGPTARGLRVGRAFDVVVAGVLVVASAPVLVVVAAVVASTSRGGALFRQVRLGRHGKPFVMYKFRTMYADVDDRPHRDYVQRLLLDTIPPVTGADGLYKLVNDPRVTPVGRFLRRSSLDELPQLLNVLKGDMSLVGPRPVLPWEAAMFGPQHRARFLVRPGITGLWQTSGRNRLSMTQALDLDVAYVAERSLRLDLRILVRTVPVVLTGRGVR